MKPMAPVAFISHSFSSNPQRNAARITAIARRVALEGCLPLAPQIYVPQFVDEATERSLALILCFALVAIADEVRVYGELTEGMRLEIAEARRLGIPIVMALVDEVRERHHRP